MPPLLGHTRTRVTARHALITQDTLNYLPTVGLTKARIATLVSSGLGARFFSGLLLFDNDGAATLSEGPTETFLYVLAGGCTVDAGPAQVKRIAPGGYLFIPAQHGCTLSGAEKETQILLVQKTYRPLADVTPPRMIVGRGGQIQPQPYQGDPDTRIQPFLPDEQGFDMSVALFTFQPGASFPGAGVHGAEHGLFFLQGQGICRLDDAWYPVKDGDSVWAAPLCPQWFVATGKTPAQFLLFRETNRLAEVL